MSDITLDGLTKRYPDGTVAVHEMDLTVADGEFVILVGPSGCGKSTTLNMIAGLEEITSGELRIGGRVMNEVPPKDRDIAMVFQSYALYPHLTVRENLAFPLTLKKLPAAAIGERVDRAAEALGLTALLERRPALLSGGQRQRVAMGRAIVRDPAAFLMDEPLSNLDARLRVQMRTQLARLQRRLGTTTIYVTHDQTEAMTLGDRVVVMRAGRVQQVGTPRELYDAPANRFVAGFIGSPAMNFLPAAVEGEHLRTPLGPIALTGENRRALQAHRGGEMVAGVRPEAFSEAAASEAGFMVTVEVVEWLGADVFAYFDVEGAGKEPLVARLAPDTAAREGEPLALRVDAEKVHLFDAESGQRIGG